MDRMQSRDDRQGPPGIKTAEDLLAKMRAGTKEVYEIRCRDLVIPVRILSVDEVNAIRRDALLHVTKIQGDKVDENLERQKVALKLASTLKPGTAPILSDRLLSLMTVDEITYLYNEYIRVMDTVNPTLETMTDEQFRVLVDALKKKVITPRDCSLHQLREICTAFVDLILRLESQSSPPANSSGGPPVE
jgi:hypothetical protein